MTTKPRFTVAPTADRVGNSIHDHDRKVAAPFGYSSIADLEAKAAILNADPSKVTAWSWRAGAYSDASKPKAPEFAKGDLVRATKGDEVYTGIVGAVDEGYIGRLEDDIEELYEAGFEFTLVRKAPVPLPTEEGYYVRSHNRRGTPGDRVYVRSTYGAWSAYGYSSGPRKFASEAELLAHLDGTALVRLVRAE